MIRLPLIPFCISLLVGPAWFSDSLLAQTPQTDQQAADQPSTSTQKYSPDVVQKATNILAEAGLKRSGKTIRAGNTVELSRAISALTRQRRELRLVRESWQNAQQRALAIRAELRRLDTQQGDLNLQLTRVAAGDVTSNNKLVGLIEATRSQMRRLVAEEESAQAETTKRRAALHQAESKYAEVVLAIRSDFNVAREQLEQAFADDKVQIALQVMHANFETPAQLSSAEMLGALNKRIEKIEQEVFSETIELIVTSGALYVDVAVGNKTTRMVVDSGATMITLPAATASELGIKVPGDARQLELQMANGESIPGRLITLPRVRVGEFEAEHVDAAVLDPVTVGAQPLLGMSYLGNFKFEIDAADKTLKMLRVVAE